jgi:putative endopeptidase
MHFVEAFEHSDVPAHSLENENSLRKAMNRKVLLRTVVSAAILSAILAETGAIAQSVTSAKPAPQRYGTWGVDLASMDKSVAPGDDFDAYTSGSWFKSAEIPADQPSTSVSYDIYNLSQKQIQAIVEASPPTSPIGGLYRSFMDEPKVEATDDKALRADLATLAALPDRASLASFMGATAGGYGGSFFGPGVYADPAQPTVNVLWLGQGGLSLPDRDYYLVDTFKPQREAYRAYIARALLMTGQPNTGASSADAVLALETEIAKVSWPADQRRDLNKINNPMTLAELQAYAPGFDWPAFFAGANVPKAGKIIVNEKDAIQKIAGIFAATSIETIKAWEAVQMTEQASPYLSKRYVESRFAFTKSLSGVTTIRPRWKRAMQRMDASLGELVGRTYVADYFPASSKAMMVELVAHLKTAMAARIKANSWMAPETKTAALEKLSRMDVMVGYPDRWRDYSALRTDPSDLYGNVKRSNAFEWDYQLSELYKPVDRSKWGMTPQTVNAYNGGLENKIVFPAGYLQAPHFDPKADMAANYGAIGSVIGHEISHGFDDQGRKIDASGAIRDWWTKADGERFDALAAGFGKQYDSYEAVPGMFINGKLTMGENIADLAGVQIALDAYHAALKGKPAAVVDGLTGDQRFFLAYAQSWRSKNREDAMRSQMASDPHSPSKFRVIGPLRNVDAWYTAFNVKSGKYYLAPEARTRIW